MVDALVSGASAARRAGSSPVLGTSINRKWLIFNHLRFLLSVRVNAVSTDLDFQPDFMEINPPESR